MIYGPNPPAYSIGTSKRNLISVNAMPGPASYNIQRDPLVRSISFNKAHKKSQSMSFNPGPGAYNLSSSIGKAPHAIIISRKQKRITEKVPGPGDYTPRGFESSIKYSIGNSSEKKIENSNPGPGAYNTQSVLKASPRAVIGKASKLVEKIHLTPGPGSYNPQFIKPGVPKFSFPMTPKGENFSDKIPGPGAYDLDLSTNTGKTALITPRRPETARHQPNPGPGSYNVDVDPFPLPKWTIAKAKKNQSFSEILPSSADYSPKNIFHNVPAYSIGNSLRIDLVQASKLNPGPGAYEVKKESSAPKFSMASKHEQKKKEVIPGPGDYENNEIRYRKKSPSAVFGTSRKQRFEGTLGPGPGRYGINRELIGPKFSFSRQKRQKAGENEGPGPGQYEIPRSIGTAKSSQSLNNTLT